MEKRSRTYCRAFRRCPPVVDALACVLSVPYLAFFLELFVDALAQWRDDCATHQPEELNHLSTMADHQQQRAKLKRQIDVEFAKLEQEQKLWEVMVMSGPFNLMDWQKTRMRKENRGGSRPSKSPNIDRESFVGHTRIWDDYFWQNPIYSDAQFIRRFRMRRPLFWKIHDAVCEHDGYFIQK